MAAIRRGGGRSSSMIVTRGQGEKERDKEFMASMLTRHREKKEGLLSSSSSSSSDSSSDDEDSGIPWRRSSSFLKKKGSNKKNKKSSKSGADTSARDVVKVRFNILLKLIVGLPSELVKDRPVYVAWRRGRKRTNRGQSRHVRATGGVVMWGESIWLEASMGATPAEAVLASSLSSSSSSSSSSSTPSAGTDPAVPRFRFDTKQLILAIKREGKSSSLGKLKIDLADYAADGSNITKEFKIPMTGTKKKTDGETSEPVLTVQFKSEWLKINNKKLVRKTGSLIQVATSHANDPIDSGTRPKTSSRPQLGSMASLVGGEYELVTDSEAEFSESDIDMTGDSDSDMTDQTSRQQASEGEDEDEWEIDSKQTELKREVAQLKQREKQLAALLEKAKRDVESKDRHILQLKVDLEKKQEKDRRMGNVANILSDMGLPLDDRPTPSVVGSTAVSDDNDQTSQVPDETARGAELSTKKLEAENQALRASVVELRELLEKKDQELATLNEQLEHLEKTVMTKDQDIKQLKREVEREKVQRIDLQINKEKEKLEEVERAINDKNEIKKLKADLRKKDKELTTLQQLMKDKEAEWTARSQQYDHEIQSLSRTIENFGRTKW